MRLIIGNKNYSSWSMRPWLLLDAHGIEFQEQMVSLATPRLRQQLLKYSDSACVPVLQDGDVSVWDSLAICEYISDQHLGGKGWPEDAADKALARSVTAEMHSSFSALRNEMPMNCRARRYIELSDEAKKDVERIDQIWSKYARVDSLGEMRLFGQFTIADCFFAPVIMRFLTYEPDVSVLARSYMRSMKSHPSFQKWLTDALQEEEIVEVDETGVERG